MEPGTIIVLNGTSSSGKSTLVRALQGSLDAPFLDAGIDRFIWMLPQHYLRPPLWSEVFEYSYPDGEMRITAADKVTPSWQQCIARSSRSPPPATTWSPITSCWIRLG